MKPIFSFKTQTDTTIQTELNVQSCSFPSMNFYNTGFTKVAALTMIQIDCTKQKVLSNLGPPQNLTNTGLLSTQLVTFDFSAVFTTSSPYCPIKVIDLVQETSELPLDPSFANLITLNQTQLQVNQSVPAGTRFRIRAQNGFSVKAFAGFEVQFII